MDGAEGAVIESPEIDAVDVDVEVEQPEEVETEQPAETESAAAAKDDPYSTRFGREFRQWLNSIKQTSPEAAKFVNQAKDSYAREFALRQLFPNGIDGVREMRGTLEAIGGAEGLTGLQERIRQTEEIDALLAAGDPKVLDTLGEQFGEGLNKIAPALLDRLAQSSPEAYESAVTPHVVAMLQRSPALQEFNRLVDILSDRDDPRLDDAKRLQVTYSSLNKMAQALNEMGQKAAAAKTPTATQDNGLHEQRTKFEQEQQQFHWQSKIEPIVVEHQKSQLESLFKPYAQRLKLPEAAKSHFFNGVMDRVNKAAAQDAAYTRQLKIFRGQKNADPAAVSNYIKTQFTKLSKTAFDAELNARYAPFLNARQKSTPTAQATKPAVSGGAALEIRTVRPPREEIDYSRMTKDDVYKNIFVLKNGKRIQVKS